MRFARTTLIDSFTSIYGFQSYAIDRYQRINHYLHCRTIHLLLLLLLHIFSHINHRQFSRKIPTKSNLHDFLPFQWNRRMKTSLTIKCYRKLFIANESVLVQICGIEFEGMDVDSNRLQSNIPAVFNRKSVKIFSC